MNMQNLTLAVIPQEDLNNLRSTQEEILQHLKELRVGNKEAVTIKNITAKEFMVAVRIGRTKFDKLVHTNKIKTIKKKRKIYVPVSEVDRYFNDPSVL
ncbi:MAG: hypothetical protein ABUT20_52795 [Bacteroidota bacterium]